MDDWEKFSETSLHEEDFYTHPNLKKHYWSRLHPHKIEFIKILK